MICTLKGIVETWILFHLWVNKYCVKKIRPKEAKLHKFKLHVSEEILLGSLLPVDGVLFSSDSLSVIDTCHVPDAIEFDEVPNKNEKDSEIHLGNKKVFLEEYPFSDRCPVKIWL